MRLQETHFKNFFKGLSFEEGPHKYTLGNKVLKYSATGVVSKFAESFDEQKMSFYVAQRDGISQEEVLKNWEKIRNEAAEKGTRVHLFGELYAKNRNLKPSCPQEKAIVKFWKDLPEHVILVAPELLMYHKDFLFAGTGDILLYNTKTGTYIIADYKTNKDIFKNYKGKTLLYPFEDLLDMPLSKFAIQLSLYQMLLEQTGVKVSSRKVVWLKKDGNYELYDTEDYTGRLKKHFKVESTWPQ